jgi:hypothetical protein
MILTASIKVTKGKFADNSELCHDNCDFCPHKFEFRLIKGELYVQKLIFFINFVKEIQYCQDKSEFSHEESWIVITKMKIIYL